MTHATEGRDAGRRPLQDYGEKWGRKGGLHERMALEK